MSPATPAETTTITTPKQSKPFVSWLKKTFLRPAGDGYTNSTSSTLEPRHPRYKSSSKPPLRVMRSEAPNRTISPTPLTPASFAPFGEVIQNPAIHENGQARLEHQIANQGTATKWLDVTHMTNHYDTASSGKPAKVVVNMFVCQPRTLSRSRSSSQGQGEVFRVGILERHPFTPQTFVPMGLGREDDRARYLVIVAPTCTTVSTSHHRPKGRGPPDLANVRAFIAKGDQAVTYGPGTWHAPMVVLGEEEIEFVVVQYANGVALEDCQECELDAVGGDGLVVAVGGGRLQSEDGRLQSEEMKVSKPGYMRAKL